MVELRSFAPLGAMRDEEEIRLDLYRLVDWTRSALKMVEQLNAELAAKAALSHTHTESDITDLDHNPDITGRTELTATPALDDEFILYDDDAATNKKVTFQNLSGVRSANITAAGSDRASATAITDQFVAVNPVGAGQGVALPAWGQDAMVIVENADASDTLKLYPDSGTNTINAGSGGASVDVAAGSWALCVLYDGSDWRVKVF